MKAILLAAAVTVGCCSLASAQGAGQGGGGQGPSASPSLTQTPKAGTTRDDRPKKAKVVKKKKKQM
jgi:hypothetical protein